MNQSFKFAMMMKKTKFYSFIPVLMTMAFMQGHRVARNSIVKSYKQAKTFAIVEFVKEMTLKNTSYYEEHGFTEHLLLFSLHWSDSVMM